MALIENSKDHIPEDIILKVQNSYLEYLLKTKDYDKLTKITPELLGIF